MLGGIIRRNTCLKLKLVKNNTRFLQHFNLLIVNMSSNTNDNQGGFCPNINNILIGSDHGGYEMKEKLKLHLKSRNVDFEDVGTYNTDSCDYPDIAQTLCNKLISTNNNNNNNNSEENNGKKARMVETRGILVCGTGIGISIAANKVEGIRCALCHDHYTATMSRKHNDANVLAIGGRTTGIEIAKEMVDIFLTEDHEGGRHSRRVNKIEK